MRTSCLELVQKRCVLHLFFFSYLEPAGWGRSCPTQSCYWPHKCSSQNPRLSLCEWQGCHYRGHSAGCQSQQVLGFHCWNTHVRINVAFLSSAAVEMVFTTSAVCLNLYCAHISFSHLMVGDGSPTALHGSTISLIQGVVTVLLKVRIRAGAAKLHTCHINQQKRCSNTWVCCCLRNDFRRLSLLLSFHFLANHSAHWVSATLSGATIWWCFSLYLSNGAEKRDHPSPGH